MARLVLFALFGIFAFAGHSALAQQTVPFLGGGCPSGTSYIGSGLCRSLTVARYIPAHNGLCPTGTFFAGAGYCQTDGITEYLIPRRGTCPLGTTYAGAGYCRGR